jgi:N-acetyl sugar amidotransferase
MVKYKERSALVKRDEFLKKFAVVPMNHEAYYGLPEEVEFCKSCVISNQRPNSAIEYKHQAKTQKETISFDQAGVCDACRFAKNKKHQIDWRDRENELIELCNKHKKNGLGYDCLVPGSGGKDSFFAAHILKYKYGMHPLTVTWAPHRYTDWGWRNFQAWLDAGFDNYLMTPNPKTHRLLTRLAVENLFHPFQPFMFGQKMLAPKMAALFDIPLIFYGENEAEYGNPIQDSETAQRDGGYFAGADDSEIFLGGTSVAELSSDFDVQSADLGVYIPIDPDVIVDKKIEVHYLGYYLPWHPQGAYYYAVDNGGFQASPERTPGTYSKYNSIDDKIDDFHYYTTFIKFGLGRASYDAAQEIRNEEISREEGVALVKKFDGEYPDRFSEEIFSYLSIPELEFPIASTRFEQPIMDREYFEHLSDTFRSPHLWKKVGQEWELRHRVWDHGIHA